MTGRYPSHTGIGPNVIRPVAPYAMPKDEVLIPQLLKKVGYKTHAVGVSPPADRLLEPEPA